MDKQKVISKVQKLLALGNCDAAAENERERAMTQANALLLKYNLDLADLPNGLKDVEVVHSIVQFYQSPWTRALAKKVAALYFCNYYFIKGTKKHLFIGEEANVATATHMVVKLVRSIEREGSVSYDTRSFCYGAAYALVEKAEALLLQNQKAATTGNAMVLYDTHNERNLDYVTKRFGSPETTKSRRQSPMEVAAYEAGRAYGQQMPLRQEIK